MEDKTKYLWLLTIETICYFEIWNLLLLLMLPLFKRQFRGSIILYASGDIKPNSGGCQNELQLQIPGQLMSTECYTWRCH